MAILRNNHILVFGKVFKTSLTSLNFLNTHFAILTLLDYLKVVWDDTMPEFVVVKRMGQITSNYTGDDKLTKVYTTFCEQDFFNCIPKQDGCLHTSHTFNCIPKQDRSWGHTPSTKNTHYKISSLVLRCSALSPQFCRTTLE